MLFVLHVPRSYLAQAVNGTQLEICVAGVPWSGLSGTRIEGLLHQAGFEYQLENHVVSVKLGFLEHISTMKTTKMDMVGARSAERRRSALDATRSKGRSIFPRRDRRWVCTGLVSSAELWTKLVPCRRG